MAIFSRRALQRLIDENAAFLHADQLKAWVDRLNNPDGDTLAAEWEVAVLNAFSRLGKVEHEPAHEKRKRPDIIFRPFRGRQIIALEIVTVSDKGLHQQNPADALFADFRRRIGKLRNQGIRGGFSLDIGATETYSVHSTVPAKLRLPKPHRFKQIIFNEDFQKFTAEVLVRPDLPRKYEVKDNEADVTVSFNPVGEGLSGEYPSYTTLYSIKRNPVANALEKKVIQLKASGFPGPFGIIMCDGGCEMVRRKLSGLASANLGQVVAGFLRRHSSVAIVLTVGVQQEGNHVGSQNLEIHSRLYESVDRAHPLDQAVINSIVSMAALLPQPMHTASNAQHHIDWLRRRGKWDEGDSLLGGWCVSDRVVKLSSRAIHELLAGQLDQRSFLKANGFDKGNPFLSKLRQGRLIARVAVEKSEIEGDDDWLAFEFGDPDPAISPFKIPESGKKT